MQTLRYWDYYDMTVTFTNLHEKAKQRESFNRLYDVIVSRENILLAYRTIKTNKGSNTKGADGKTIEDIKKLDETNLVYTIRQKLLNYQPKKVRRVYIPKHNGKKRPLGIPCIVDRIIQQCFKQVLEPITEAYFYNHSYGFRPMRSAHHAMARVQFLVNQAKLHYVVDVDIKGFFDNVNHTLLIKQLWNLGIQDKKVLQIISKMLKADIDGEGKPSKGTPQGGILSPLLSNVVLHDVDKWVSDQWEYFETHYPYTDKGYKHKVLKKTNLKEGYIVRYADDFKILCRDWKTAQKWYHAIRLYLKDRLKLDISPEKSQVVNLRKRESEFLGFTIKVIDKGKKKVARTGITDKKKQQIKQQCKELIKKIQQSPTVKNGLLFNSFVLGIHNYFKKATHVNIEFSHLAYELSRFIYNRLKKTARYIYPANPPPTYKKFYSITYRTYWFGGIYLFPLKDVRTVNNMNFSQNMTPFTLEGRNMIYKQLKSEVQLEITKLMKSNLPNKSVEYMDNRISRYSMKMGKCEITNQVLKAEDVHCHHYKPLGLGGSDKFDNLRIIHKDVHKLIHSTEQKKIKTLINVFNIDDKTIKIVNQYRKRCNLELIG